MTEQVARVSAVARVGFAPIIRVDVERREIELCATSEALDTHGTIFDYEASKAAFTRWLGNVREMHERRAVGRRVAVRCDDETRRVFVRLRISRGAQDTWEKVLDGTLRGASIGASDVVWRRERRAVQGRNRWVQVASSYDLVELSLVDSPSNPDALGVTFVRDATPDAALLDPLDAPDAPDTEEPPDADVETEQRAGQIASGDTRQPLHEATRTLLSGCGCTRCVMALAALAEDVDDAAEAAPMGAMTRALAARLDHFEATLRSVVAALQSPIQRRLASASAEGEDGQAARVVEELRARVARLEAQPLPGGPAARPVEKALAGVSMASAHEREPLAEYRALEALAGRLRDPQAQLAVAAEMIRLQQGGE